MILFGHVFVRYMVFVTKSGLLQKCLFGVPARIVAALDDRSQGPILEEVFQLDSLVDTPVSRISGIYRDASGRRSTPVRQQIDIVIVSGYAATATTF